MVKYTFIFFHSVIQDFISRLWLGLRDGIYLTDSFAFTRCMPSMSILIMAVKGYFHIVPRDSEMKRPRNQSSMHNVNRNKCSVDLQVSHLLQIEQSSPATGPGYGAEIVPKVAFLV